MRKFNLKISLSIVIHPKMGAFRTQKWVRLLKNNNKLHTQKWVRLLKNNNKLHTQKWVRLYLSKNTYY
jgi:hypothetical protein